MFVLKDKKTNEILMIGSHKTVCRYFAVEREIINEKSGYRRDALIGKTPDKAFVQECEHLYEIVEVPSYTKDNVSKCFSYLAKRKINNYVK